MREEVVSVPLDGSVEGRGSVGPEAVSKVGPVNI